MEKKRKQSLKREFTAKRDYAAVRVFIQVEDLAIDLFTYDGVLTGGITAHFCLDHKTG